ncbi:hypothetical protein [Tsukamurella hominis]|uniref:hypothetical protein n=1 Tax=Tsukamurella hominis TaxID=1970232 RepID=UPI0039EA9E90
MATEATTTIAELETDLRKLITRERDHPRRLAAVRAAVNTARHERGLPAVPLQQIADIDDSATGADWARKFALRASLLARGGDR